MQTANRLKTAFTQGKQSMGMWQMIPGANVARILAHSGVDWVLVDCEHGNMDGMSIRQNKAKTKTKKTKRDEPEANTYA